MNNFFLLMSCISSTGLFIDYEKLLKYERLNISVQGNKYLEINIYADDSPKIRIFIEEKYDVDVLHKQIKKISDEIDVITNLENWSNDLTDDHIKIVEMLISDKTIQRYAYSTVIIRKLVFFNIKFQFLCIVFAKGDYLERLEHLLCLMQYYHLDKCYVTIYYKLELEQLQKYLPEEWNLVERSSTDTTITCTLERD